MKCELAEIVTKDKLVHQGIYFVPKKRAQKAILWVHGLTGRFSGDPKLMNLFAEFSEKHDMGFASFNNRGHDIIASFRKVDPDKPEGYGHVMVGAGMETFEECVLDIDAAISFLTGQGFTEIFLAGHSTGANKVCFYGATKTDPRVAGIVLAGPLSDRLSQQADQFTYQKNLLIIKALIAAGKGDEIQQNRYFFPITPKRAFSLLASNTAEDVFNYGDTTDALSVVAVIKKPLMVVFAGNDELADRPIETIKQAFDTHTKSKQYMSKIILNTTHGFTGKEQEFVSLVVKWAASL